MRTETRIMSLSDSLKELAALGSPVDLEAGLAGTESARLEIVQCGGVNDNALLELDHGRIGYVLSVSVTNQTSRPMHIVDLELRTPWDEQLFDWSLPRTIETRARRSGKMSSYKVYLFPGKAGFEFPFAQVVNHALMPGQSLSPRRPVSGCLLATGGIMPQDLLNGNLINATLIITTSDHIEHCGQVGLRVERRKLTPKLPSPKAGLYSSSGIADRRLRLEDYIEEAQKAQITRADEAK